MDRIQGPPAHRRAWAVLRGHPALEEAKFRSEIVAAEEIVGFYRSPRLAPVLVIPARSSLTQLSATGEYLLQTCGNPARRGRRRLPPYAYLRLILAALDRVYRSRWSLRARVR